MEKEAELALNLEERPSWPDPLPASRGEQREQRLIRGGSGRGGQRASGEVRAEDSATNAWSALLAVGAR